MITFLVAVALLIVATPAHWGWWLLAIAIAWFVDTTIVGFQRLAAARPEVYGATSPLVVEAEQRLVALRESTRRTIDEIDRIAAEVREDRRRRDVEGRGL